MFPLGSVLFPTMVLPLHIFEERYRALVTDCLAGEQEFGVCLIERGFEVGGGDFPRQGQAELLAELAIPVDVASFRQFHGKQHRRQAIAQLGRTGRLLRRLTVKLGLRHFWPAI